MNSPSCNWRDLSLRENVVWSLALMWVARPSLRERKRFFGGPLGFSNWKRSRPFSGQESISGGQEGRGSRRGRVTACKVRSENQSKCCPRKCSNLEWERIPVSRLSIAGWPFGSFESFEAAGRTSAGGAPGLYVCWRRPSGESRWRVAHHGDFGKVFRAQGRGLNLPGCGAISSLSSDGPID